MGITHHSDNNNTQSAIVFQGGWALGAYEAGAFDVLYYWIKKDHAQRKENIFDIVAGTSIGAINAAILVSYVNDRKNDITYQDRTDYDQKVAVFVSDYIDLIRQIGDVAISSINALKDLAIKANLKKQFDAILSTNAKSTKRDGGPRLYEDLIKGRFNLDTTFYLERQDDPDTISNKWFDLSTHTITKLIEDGRIQALRKLLQKEGSSICSQLNLFMNEVENSLQNQEITQRHADELKRIVNIVKKENRCS